MKINNISNIKNSVPFHEVEHGDIFRYEGNLYLKTKILKDSVTDNEGQAVSLSDGRLLIGYFGYDEPVERYTLPIEIDEAGFIPKEEKNG